MSGENFNVAGVNDRDCPICYRAGSLTGNRVDGGALECSGCRSRFTLHLGEGAWPQHTLARVRPAAGERSA